jgi:hypothetical protein
MGSDLVYSILSPEWNADKTSTRFFMDCSRTPVPRNRFVQVRSMEEGSMEEAGSGHEDSSHNILTLDALQVLSRSQVTLELSMSMRIRPICKSLHTYIHTYLMVQMVFGPSLLDLHCRRVAGAFAQCHMLTPAER